MDRRRFLALAAGGTGLALVARAAAPRRIPVTARRFEFVPAEISVRAGESVTFVVTSEDFLHGFSMPDFGLRQDLMPGKAVEVTITPAKAGRFHYLCDNFCGEGHDKMSGILVVT